tara:strand:+ start:340 stop:1377 length:1038 start_codon:yes stop_codon:yes gene_type:complete
MAPIELDPIPDPVYPDGGKTGAFDASGNIYEAQELLHRPHAFALMHGTNGAKVAYGELHYIVNSFKLKFETSAISVADHDDHSHAPHCDHTHDPHTGSTSTDNGSSTGYGETSSQSTSTSGSADGGGYSGGPHTHSISHSHDVEMGHTHTVNLTHSGVKDTDGTSPSDCVLKHTGVRGISGGFGTDSSAESGVLSHTVSGQKIFCSGASQESLGNITQKVPNVKTEDGKPMNATINEEYYHELGEYGDVYLCWKVDLEDVGNEVTKCWVQVGEPDGDPVIALDMGNATTNRRNSSTPHTATGQKEGEDAGVYRIKLGNVTQGSKVIQYVSSDVVWQPTVLDREQV